MARPDGPFAGFEGGAEPAKDSGIAPGPEPGRRGKASARTATRTGFVDEASAFEMGSGRAARPSGGAAFRKGISTGFGLARFLEGREGFRAHPLSKGRPERLRPRCEPWRRRGFGRTVSDPGSGGGISVSPKRPDGDRRAAFGPLPGPTGCRTGLRGLAPGPEESEAGVSARLAIRSRPARDGLATQRRQSKLGQVGAGGDTGPHYDSGGPPLPLSAYLAPFLGGGGRILLREGTKAQWHEAIVRAPIHRRCDLA